MEKGDKKEDHGNLNPWDIANPVSKLLFLWVLPFFCKESKTNAYLEEIYKVPKEFRSKVLAENAIKNWEIECISSTNKRQPKLIRMLLKTHWKSLVISLIMMLVDECTLRIIPVLVLGRFVNSFHVESPDRANQFVYAALICFVPYLHTLMLYSTTWRMQRLGYSCRIALSSLIFRKALKMPQGSKKQTKVGHVANLLSNDVGRFDINFYMSLSVIAAPIQFGLLMYFIWAKLEDASFVGGALILLLAPAQYIYGILSKKFRTNIAKCTDERSRIMNEIIEAISVIKMYAWENAFSSLIMKIRRLEIQALKKSLFLKGFVSFVYSISSKVIPYATIVAIVISGNDLNAGKIFFVIAMYNILSDAIFCQAPGGISWIGELISSLNRIEDFLLSEEKQQSVHYAHQYTSQSKETYRAEITIKNAVAKWSDETFALNRININIFGNKLVVIAGAVGSGKTSLLNAVISELELSHGICKINGRISYSSQESWILTGSIRQNIIFKSEYNEQRYKEVLTACALKDDFKQLPYGDMTMIGERGLSLSGGQKARINLARAIYREADIYLLDDPLSALDSRVSRQIFDKCIREHLKGKLRVLATHQLQYLSQADHIVVLDKGHIRAQGTYDDLKEMGIDIPCNLANETEENVEEQTRIAENYASTKNLDNHSGCKEQKEGMHIGSVTNETYVAYFRYGGNMIHLFLSVLFIVLSQIFLRSADYWLSLWTTTFDRPKSIVPLALAQHSEFEYDIHENTTINIVDIVYSKDYFPLYMYTGLIATFIFCSAIKVYLYFSYSIKIGTNLYNGMFNSLIRATSIFFEKNPSGRIINRFIKDVGTFDELIPITFYNSIECLAQLIGVIAVIIFSNFYFIIPAAITFSLLWTVRTIYIKTARKAKRIESVAKSPMFTHLSTSMLGISTIRTFGNQEEIIKEFDDMQDTHSSAWFIVISTSRAFSVWIDQICAIFLTLVTFGFLTVAKDSTTGNVGLVLTSLMTLLSSLQFGTRQSADTETQMTSVERALEYVHLDSEAPLVSQNDNKPPKDWPKCGRIEFRNVSLSYNGENDVLKNVSFEIRPQEKIGVVGRTGAGKTSIISALFRMTEPRGEIFIDGIRINNIGLHDVRKNISIIPQDPVLFCGTIRYNLDPFGCFEDADLWNVISEIRLKEVIHSLELQVTDGGGNFSVGERQLICLARALLRKNKIIVMDEATANVDPRTDNFIQNTIRSKFFDCTIITIAHRLHTVMDSDRILVLDNGTIQEFDHPYILLQNTKGALSSLVKLVGTSGQAKLNQIAHESYFLSYLCREGGKNY